MAIRFITGILLVSVLAGCSGGGGQNKGLMRKASGRGGEVMLVMDSTKWRGKLGDEVRKTFRAQVVGLPRPEPVFTLHYVDPRKLNSVLKSATNMIFVTTLSSKSQASAVLRNYFTSSSLQKIQEDPSLFLHINKDEFARGQSVMYLFGQNDETLIKNMSDNRDRLRRYFDEIEKERLMSSLYVAKEVTGINDHLLNTHNFQMRIPNGYQIADEQSNFIWLRNVGVEVDRNLIITYVTYKSESQFDDDELIKWRNIVAKKYLFEDPDIPESFVVTEDRPAPVVKQLTWNGKYAKEMKGLWKTNNLAMGGPFIGYAFTDEGTGRIYYVEGFLYSPGKSQREFMRELSTILSTFKTQAELASAN